jgi:hypothetical protein
MAARGTKPATKPSPGSAKQVATGARSFFNALQDRGYEPILQGESGSLRFDLSRESELERWYVAVAHGNITVSHARSRADTVVKVNGELLDQIAEGTANCLTAQLRGVLEVEGDLHLLMVFQRLFPGPPRRSADTPPAPVRKKGAPR